MHSQGKPPRWLLAFIDFVRYLAETSIDGSSNRSDKSAENSTVI